MAVAAAGRPARTARAGLKSTATRARQGYKGRSDQRGCQTLKKREGGVGNRRHMYLVSSMFDDPSPPPRHPIQWHSLGSLRCSRGLLERALYIPRYSHAYICVCTGNLSTDRSIWQLFLGGRVAGYIHTRVSIWPDDRAHGKPRLMPPSNPLPAAKRPRVPSGPHPSLLHAIYGNGCAPGHLVGPTQDFSNVS